MPHTYACSTRPENVMLGIRVNDQWRVCFEWPERSPGSANVEIVDYH